MPDEDAVIRIDADFGPAEESLQAFVQEASNLEVEATATTTAAPRKTAASADAQADQFFKLLTGDVVKLKGMAGPGGTSRPEMHDPIKELNKHIQVLIQGVGQTVAQLKIVSKQLEDQRGAKPAGQEGLFSAVLAGEVLGGAVGSAVGVAAGVQAAGAGAIPSEELSGTVIAEQIGRSISDSFDIAGLDQFVTGFEEALGDMTTGIVSFTQTEIRTSAQLVSALEDAQRTMSEAVALQAPRGGVPFPTDAEGELDQDMLQGVGQLMGDQVKQAFDHIEQLLATLIGDTSVGSSMLQVIRDLAMQRNVKLDTLSHGLRDVEQAVDNIIQQGFGVPTEFEGGDDGLVRMAEGLSRMTDAIGLLAQLVRAQGVEDSNKIVTAIGQAREKAEEGILTLWRSIGDVDDSVRSRLMTLANRIDSFASQEEATAGLHQVTNTILSSTFDLLGIINDNVRASAAPSVDVGIDTSPIVEALEPIRQALVTLRNQSTQIRGAVEPLDNSTKLITVHIAGMSTRIDGTLKSEGQRIRQSIQDGVEALMGSVSILDESMGTQLSKLGEVISSIEGSTTLMESYLEEIAEIMRGGGGPGGGGVGPPVVPRGPDDIIASTGDLPPDTQQISDAIDKLEEEKRQKGLFDDAGADVDDGGLTKNLTRAQEDLYDNVADLLQQLGISLLDEPIEAVSEFGNILHGFGSDVQSLLGTGSELQEFQDKFREITELDIPDDLPDKYRSSFETMMERFKLLAGEAKGIEPSDTGSVELPERATGEELRQDVKLRASVKEALEEVQELDVALRSMIDTAERLGITLRADAPYADLSQALANLRVIMGQSADSVTEHSGTLREWLRRMFAVRVSLEEWMQSLWLEWRERMSDPMSPEEQAKEPRDRTRDDTITLFDAMKERARSIAEDFDRLAKSVKEETEFGFKEITPFIGTPREGDRPRGKGFVTEVMPFSMDEVRERLDRITQELVETTQRASDQFGDDWASVASQFGSLSDDITDILEDSKLSAQEMQDALIDTMRTIFKVELPSKLSRPMFEALDAIFNDLAATVGTHPPGAATMAFKESPEFLGDSMKGLIDSLRSSESGTRGQLENDIARVRATEESLEGVLSALAAEGFEIPDSITAAMEELFALGSVDGGELIKSGAAVTQWSKELRATGDILQKWMQNLVMVERVPRDLSFAFEELAFSIRKSSGFIEEFAKKLGEVVVEGVVPEVAQSGGGISDFMDTLRSDLANLTDEIEERMAYDLEQSGGVEPERGPAQAVHDAIGDIFDFLDESMMATSGEFAELVQKIIAAQRALEHFDRGFMAEGIDRGDARNRNPDGSLKWESEIEGPRDEEGNLKSNLARLASELFFASIRVGDFRDEVVKAAEAAAKTPFSEGISEEMNAELRKALGEVTGGMDQFQKHFGDALLEIRTRILEELDGVMNGVMGFGEGVERAAEQLVGLYNLLQDATGFSKEMVRVQNLLEKLKEVAGEDIIGPIMEKMNKPGLGFDERAVISAGDMGESAKEDFDNMVREAMDAAAGAVTGGAGEGAPPPPTPPPVGGEFEDFDKRIIEVLQDILTSTQSIDEFLRTGLAESIMTLRAMVAESVGILVEAIRIGSGVDDDGVIDAIRDLQETVAQGNSDIEMAMTSFSSEASSNVAAGRGGDGPGGFMAFLSGGKGLMAMAKRFIPILGAGALLKTVFTKLAREADVLSQGFESAANRFAKVSPAIAFGLAEVEISRFIAEMRAAEIIQREYARTLSKSAAQVRSQQTIDALVADARIKLMEEEFRLLQEGLARGTTTDFQTLKGDFYRGLEIFIKQFWDDDNRSLWIGGLNAFIGGMWEDVGNAWSRVGDEIKEGDLFGILGATINGIVRTVGSAAGTLFVGLLGGITETLGSIFNVLGDIFGIGTNEDDRFLGGRFQGEKSFEEIRKKAAGQDGEQKPLFEMKPVGPLDLGPIKPLSVSEMGRAVEAGVTAANRKTTNPLESLIPPELNDMFTKEIETTFA